LPYSNIILFLKILIVGKYLINTKWAYIEIDNDKINKINVIKKIKRKILSIALGFFGELKRNTIIITAIIKLRYIQGLYGLFGWYNLSDFSIYLVFGLQYKNLPID